MVKNMLLSGYCPKDIPSSLLLALKTTLPPKRARLKKPRQYLAISELRKKLGPSV